MRRSILAGAWRRSAVGVDISDGAIRVVAVSAGWGRGGCRLDQCESEPLAGAVVAGGAVRDAGSAGRALTRATARAGIRARRAALALPAGLTITRTVRLPGSVASEEVDWHVEAMALQMALQMVPQARAVNFGIAFADCAAVDGGTAPVHVVAADGERVRERVAVAAIAGLAVCAVEPEEAARRRGTAGFPTLDPAFAVAAGLALRAVREDDRGHARIPGEADLLRSADERRTDRRRRFCRLLAGVVTCALLGAVSAGYRIGRETAAVRRLNMLLADGIARLDDRQRRTAATREHMATQRERLAAVGRLQQGRGRLVTLLAALSRLVPDDVFLSGLKQDGAGFTLAGFAASSERVHDLLGRLGAVDWLDGVALIESRAGRPPAGTLAHRMMPGGVAFSLRFAYPEFTPVRTRPVAPATRGGER